MFNPMMFLPHSYDLDLDRRWRRCGYLICHGRRPSWKRDDKVTWEAWRFRLKVDCCHDEADRRQLDRDFPAVAEAYQLYTTPTPLKRWELEARLLANETDAVIAAKCGLSVEAVHTYGELFYDVRPRLHADTYISTVVLEGKGTFPIAPDDYEAILKIFGYSKGGCVVDDVLDYIREPPIVPACLSELDLPALERLRRHLKLKLQILHLSTPASALPATTWQRLGQYYAAAIGSTQGREENETDVPCSLKATLDLTAILSGSVQAGVDAETNSSSISDAICITGVPLCDRDVLTGDQNIPKAVPA